MEDKITIPTKLKKGLKEKMKEANFKSIQEYVLFILEQIVFGAETEGYSEKDEADLNQTLKDMGYLPQ